MVNEGTVCIVDEDAQSQATIESVADSVGLKTEAYASAEHFLEGYEETPEDAKCLVIGLRLPGMSGLHLLQRLVADRYAIPVVMTTAWGDVPTAVAATKLGAVDFMEKPVHRQELLDRIYESLDQWRAVQMERARRKALQQRLNKLSMRERDVMEQIVAGKNHKQIASGIGIGVKTVIKHRARLFQKMGVNNVVDLVNLLYSGQAATMLR